MGLAASGTDIKDGDPLSAVMKTHWTEVRERGKWKIRTETYGELKATKTHWLVKGRIEAFEGAKKTIFTKKFEREDRAEAAVIRGHRARVYAWVSPSNSPYDCRVAANG